MNPDDERMPSERAHDEVASHLALQGRRQHSDEASSGDAAGPQGTGVIFIAPGGEVMVGRKCSDLLLEKRLELQASFEPGTCCSTSTILSQPILSSGILAAYSIRSEREEPAVDSSSAAAAPSAPRAHSPLQSGFTTSITGTPITSETITSSGFTYT